MHSRDASITGEMQSPDDFQWTRERLTFVQLFVATDDAIAAARDSKITDDIEKLLAHPPVIEKIAEYHDAFIRRAWENPETVLGRFSNLADANIFDYFSLPEGQDAGTVNHGKAKLLDLKAMPVFMQQRVKKFKTTTTTNAAGDRTSNFEIEIHDAMAANTHLARLLRVGEEDVYDAEEVAQQMYEFFQEIETVRAVEGGEFPEDKPIEI